MEKGDTTAASDLIGVNIKFMGRSIPISLFSDSTVRDLKSRLRPLTNVLPRCQKLIFKGRILDDDATLRSSEVSNGAKIMLMASQRPHQGVGPIGEEAPTSSSRMEWDNMSEAMKATLEIIAEKSNFEPWKGTSGVIELSGLKLTAIPDQVWDFGSSARVLDLSHNSLHGVPVSVGSLCCLQKLFLTANRITDSTISWEGLTSLKSLTVLSLSQNLLCTISSSIGECTSLVEIDMSLNLLGELPESFGNLQNLEVLDISNNGLQSLPTALFKKCIQLSTLVFYGTDITLDILRQFEGWEDFEERCLLKHQKILNFRAGGSAEFDEGADKRF